MTRHYYINQIKDLSTNFDDKTKSNILTELDNYHLDEMKQVSTKIDAIYKVCECNNGD